MSVLAGDSPLVFLVLIVIFGGGGAFLSGRALAHAWRPFRRVALYMILLAAAVRFFDYALFSASLLSPYGYVLAYAVLLVASALGYRLTRTHQMVTQYRWLYERTSPLTWRERRVEKEA